MRRRSLSEKRFSSAIRFYMRDASDGVEYTPLSSVGTSTTPQTVARFCSLKVIMIVLGIVGATLLTSLLIVFVAPGSRAQSNVSDPGTAFTSPPYYPARKLC